MNPDYGSALIELTTQCNLSCAHCVHPENGQQTLDKISLAIIEKVLDSLVEAGILSLTLTGGEPLLCSSLFDIIALARKRKFLVKIKSNGQLLDETMAHRLKEAGVFAVDISLYSYESDYHDHITQCPDSFRRSCQAVKNILLAGMKGRILTSLFHPLIDLNMMSLFAKTFPVPIVYDPLVHDTFDHRRIIDNLSLTREEMRTYIRYMVRLGEYRIDMEPQQRQLCKIGTHKTIYIDYAGNFKPCGNYPVVTGNIMTTTVEEVLAAWRSLRENLDAHRPCTSCEISHYCHPCVAISFLETGDACGCSPRLRRFAEAYRDVVREIKENT